MKLSSFATAITAVLLLSACAQQAPPEAVVPTQQAEAICATPEQVIANKPPGVRVLRLKGWEAKAFMNAYNAVPPKTDIPADEVFLLDKPRSSKVIVLRFVNGCATSQGLHSRKHVQALLAQALGRSA